MRAFCVLACLTIACLPAPQTSRADEFSDAVVKHANLRRGICAVVGPADTLPVTLARQTEWLVHTRQATRKQAEELQQRADAAGLGIRRVTIEHGPMAPLPYADRTIDLVVFQATPALLKQLTADEVLRVLCPRGVALVSLPGDAADMLTSWRKQQGTDVQTSQAAGRTLLQFRAPPLVGTDDWSHWEKEPDNNPVSNDQVIKAPYMSQYFAEPYYIGMPAVTTASAGRTFLAVGHIAHHVREWNMLNRIIARNGYNGTVLWERKLPEGYMVHRSAFIATPETFYMIGGDRGVKLDPETGEIQGTIVLPQTAGDWKWMAMHDGILYVLVGKRAPGVKSMRGDRTFGGWSWADLSPDYYGPEIPWGYGHTMVAYDLQTKKEIWQHKEEFPIDSRSLSMVQNKLFLMCPGHFLRGLELKTGDVIWTNEDKQVHGLIAEPGKGLTSTPGFRSMTLAVATPKALILQGQTRMNVVAVSTETGYLLWNKKKVTNNPNAVYLDGKVILGVGKGGNNVVVDPVSGKEEADLGFRKVNCTRLTASTDSLFCRGEGTMRYDRETGKMLVDGGIRPACNDGAIPANGLLYLGPWACDCNLSLIGAMAKCSAGDFKFDYEAKDAERLETFAELTQPLETTAADWPTYRRDNARSSGTQTNGAVRQVGRGPRWTWQPDTSVTVTPPVVAGGLVFTAGEDGRVRAIDASNGQLKWEFQTPAPIKASPSIWEGRAYLGSGDGRVYCLEAATGKLLWRYRAAPVDRHIMVYGALQSTWPVNTGVLVQDGACYFAAGIIDHDGTYVYALDAKTGKLRWQNNSSGHLSAELRKGISAMGSLAIHKDRLLLAAGNQFSPCPFDLRTGECLAPPLNDGRPKANAGKFVGVFAGDHPIVGGRILYSSPENVATKGSFTIYDGGRGFLLNYGGIPPAWNEQTMALVNFKRGKLTACDTAKVAQRVQKGYPQQRRDWRRNLTEAFNSDGAIRWQSDLEQSNKFEAVALAVCPNAILAVVQYQNPTRSQPQWYLAALNPANGQPLYRVELDGAPLPDALAVDRSGHAVLAMLDGRILSIGGGQPGE